MTVTCPTCNRRFEPAESETMPFCSVRCQQRDLSRWLNEEFALPMDPEREDEDEPWDEDEGSDSGPDGRWN